MQPYEQAARAINEDWGTSFDKKQIQRWTERTADDFLDERGEEVFRSQCGSGPVGPQNPPELLVVEMDGGRVQMKEADKETEERWRENKVGTVASCHRGRSGKKPEMLVKTYVATMKKAEDFGTLLYLEAERRGLHRAEEVVIVGDGGNWIDPLVEKHFEGHARIVDWYHAVEHLYECGRAIHPGDDVVAKRWAKQTEALLWEGKTDRVIEMLEEETQKRGRPTKEDEAEHPRRVLYNNWGYFRKHKGSMKYDEYRRRGWPIGSGIVEAGVKQMNKRVKGTEQFWREEGVEGVLWLRSMWLSEDERWDRAWRSKTAYAVA